MIGVETYKLFACMKIVLTDLIKAASNPDIAQEASKVNSALENEARKYAIWGLNRSDSFDVELGIHPLGLTVKTPSEHVIEILVPEIFTYRTGKFRSALAAKTSGIYTDDTHYMGLYVRVEDILKDEFPYRQWRLVGDSFVTPEAPGEAKEIANHCDLLIERYGEPHADIGVGTEYENEYYRATPKVTVKVGKNNEPVAVEFRADFNSTQDARDYEYGSVTKMSVRMKGRTGYTVLNLYPRRLRDDNVAVFDEYAPHPTLEDVKEIVRRAEEVYSLV